jgi:hypothetical protein
MTDTSALEVYLRTWTRTNSSWRHESATQIADRLAQEADFGQLRLAEWLRTPEAHLIEQVVTKALPYPDQAAVALLSEAVQLAASQRTRNERLMVGGLVVAAGLLLVCAMRS